MNPDIGAQDCSDGVRWRVASLPALDTRTSDLGGRVPR